MPIITHPHIFFEAYTKQNVAEHNMHRPNAVIALEYRGRLLCLVTNFSQFHYYPLLLLYFFLTITIVQ